MLKLMGNLKTAQTCFQNWSYTHYMPYTQYQHQHRCLALCHTLPHVVMIFMCDHPQPYGHICTSTMVHHLKATAHHIPRSTRRPEQHGWLLKRPPWLLSSWYKSFLEMHLKVAYHSPKDSPAVLQLAASWAWITTSESAGIAMCMCLKFKKFNGSADTSSTLRPFDRLADTHC